MSELSIEDTIKKLIEMHGYSRVDREQSKVADQLLKNLKKKGLTNKKIEQMTGGKWKESAIKYHTKGVSVTDSLELTSSLEKVGSMISQGLDLEQAKQAAETKRILEGQGVTLGDAAHLIAEARNFGINIQSLVSIMTEVKKSGIPVGDLAEIFAYRNMLAKLGVSTNMVDQLIATMSKFGGFDKTVEALDAFGDLLALRSEVSQHTSTGDALRKSNNELQSQVDASKKRKDLIQSDLDLYQVLVDKGFDQATLTELKVSAQRYGGPKQVLEAINRYRDFIELNKTIEDVKLRAEAEAGKLEKLKADYVHVLQVTIMCDKLFELGFDVPAIERIYDTAKKYGEPLEVLNAIGQYGRLSEIQREKEEAIAKARQLETKLTDHEEVKRQRDEAVRNLTDSYKGSIRIIQEIIEELEKPQDQRQFRKELAESNLPAEIGRLLADALNRWLKTANNDELVMAFQNEARSQVNEFLRLWSTRLLGIRTRDKTKKLKDAQHENPSVALKGEWSKPCRDCSQDHILRLESVFDIREVLRNGSIKAGAQSIIEHFKGKHSVTFTLDELVMMYLIKRVKSRY